MKQRLQAWGDSKVVPIVSCLIFNEAHDILLLKRHAEDLGGNRWTTPGGRIDSGESAAAAMRRELLEETGLLAAEQLISMGVHEVRMPHGSIHMTSYHAVVPRHAVITIDPDEHQSYRWLPVQDLLRTAGIIWGLPTVLRDFELLGGFEADPTLADGSTVRLLERFSKR
jgi:8-oxo-dGTP diphosphatase